MIMDFACRDIFFICLVIIASKNVTNSHWVYWLDAGVRRTCRKWPVYVKGDLQKRRVHHSKRPMKENYWLCLIPHGSGQVFSHRHTTHTHTQTRHDLISVLRCERESVYPSHTQHIHIFFIHAHTHMRTHTQRTFWTDLPNLSRAIRTIKSFSCAQSRQ